jgi:hypothetical protein
VGRNRYVKPEVVRYDLADGDWIDVKKYLSAGEELAISGGAVTGVRQSLNAQTFELDIPRLKFSRLLAYVTRWSFVRPDGSVAQTVTLEEMEDLDRETIDEMDAVLDKHIEAMTAAKNAQRSAPVGVTN